MAEKTVTSRAGRTLICSNLAYPSWCTPLWRNGSGEMLMWLLYYCNIIIAILLQYYATSQVPGNLKIDFRESMNDTNTMYRYRQRGLPILHTGGRTMPCRGEWEMRIGVGCAGDLFVPGYEFAVNLTFHMPNHCHHQACYYTTWWDISFNRIKFFLEGKNGNFTSTLMFRPYL
jgi:hypothetical protein